MYFVNPSAYRAFQETGLWPNKTTLLLEICFNKHGHTQSQEVMGIAVHAKDAVWKVVAFSLSS